MRIATEIESIFSLGQEVFIYTTGLYGQRGCTVPRLAARSCPATSDGYNHIETETGLVSLKLNQNKAWIQFISIVLIISIFIVSYSKISYKR